jgi:hypothetical protein
MVAVLAELVSVAPRPPQCIRRCCCMVAVFVVVAAMFGFIMDSMIFLYGSCVGGRYSARNFGWRFCMICFDGSCAVVVV